jgi:hypothetical protein
LELARLLAIRGEVAAARAEYEELVRRGGAPNHVMRELAALEGRRR